MPERPSKPGRAGWAARQISSATSQRSAASGAPREHRPRLHLDAVIEMKLGSAPTEIAGAARLVARNIDPAAAAHAGMSFGVQLAATPTMSVGHLLFAGGLTAYMGLAALVEERDLVAYFGRQYEDYRQRVPMFIPRWKKGVALETSPKSNSTSILEQSDAVVRHLKPQTHSKSL